LLSRLHIKHFAIIKEEQVSFETGFTALTGETGAGKSILLDAINLLLGGRASADMVRRGESKALVEAVFSLGKHERQSLEARLVARSIPVNPKGDLSVKRVINISGRNHAHINRTRVSSAVLRELTEGLVEIVRQHESYTLLDPDQHLAQLDTFGEIEEEASELRHEVMRWRELENEQRRLKSSQADRMMRIQELQNKIDHIERLGPEPQEDEKVERDLRILHAAESLREWLEGGIHRLYDDSNSTLGQLNMLNKGLEPLVHVDERLAGFYEAIERAHMELDELTHDLRRFRGEIPHDHSALIELETRRAQLEQLKDEYGLSLEEILEQTGKLREERDQLEQLSLRVKEAEIEAQGALATAQLRAQHISDVRVKLGPRLATQIEAELQHLGMAQCRFKVSFETSKLTAQGSDRVEFLISPNPGEGFKPLARIASGGELSRLMLALKVVLMDSDHTPTYVFDEVDTGIGGAVAEGVGIKLKRISDLRQVICITHLPQVASNAHRHLKIAKEMHADRTYSSIRELSQIERVEEVARMLGGQDLTEKTIAHAREMVERGHDSCSS
jgi:DNA repair protein RecN (Recombination protein N)